MTPHLPPALRRIITRVCITFSLAWLTAQAVEVLALHRSAGVTVLTVAVPVIGTLSGLLHLRLTREKP